MRERRLPWVLLLGVLAAPSGLVEAGSGRTWSASAPQEWARGTMEGTTLGAEGGITLAPEERLLWGPADGIVWDLAVADSGVWAALSSPGRVVRVTRESTVQWHEVEGESLIAAVAPDPDGGVWFGVSPQGQLYRADAPARGRPLAVTGARFIWALEPAAGGGLWIGTGQPGTLQHFRDGVSRTWYDSGDDPVRCIEQLPGGDVLIGTGGRGRVIRLDAANEPFVLFDADEAEIVALQSADDGSVYALAAAGTRQVAPPANAEGPQADTTVKVTATAPPDGNGDGDGGGDERTRDRPQPQRGPQRLSVAPGAKLYRLDPETGVHEVWQSTQAVPLSLVRSPHDILVGTGDRGRVFAIGDDRQRVLMDIASDQVSALAASPDGTVYVAGTGDARVVELGSAPRRRGVYYGPVVDAGSPARWGRVDWNAERPGGTGLQMEVRAGNTAEADDTWTEWHTVDPDGALEGVLPSTRWLQVRATLEGTRRGDGPTLHRLSLHYAPRNRAPRITTLGVEPAGVVWTPGPTSGSTPRGPIVADDPVARRAAESLARRAGNSVRKSYERGARTVSWKADDVDGDRLTFRLELRREGTEHWVPLMQGGVGSFFGWDARGFPDGDYRVRLTADDARDNPDGSSFQDQSVSAVFRVDNTRPVVGTPEVRRDGSGYVVEFVATDPGGYVAAVEVAVDAGEWQPVEPVDGVADSPEERYTTQVASDEDDEHRPTLRIRVTDESGNLGGDAWPLE